jgi:hypothetical protein
MADVVQLITAQPNPQGTFALFEFGGTLPRARLYTRWDVQTNGARTLETLKSPAFNPETTVLLGGAPGINPAADAAPGEASITEYQPRHVVIRTRSKTAGVLLLNDRWSPDWKVTVDGKPTPLLQANFLMRGAAVDAGEHTVEFRFEPPAGTLWVSVSAILAAAACIALLCVVGRPATPSR